MARDRSGEGRGKIPRAILSKEVRPRDLVWSWRADEPNGGGGENCAFITDDGMADLPCSYHLPYACRGAAGSWQVTQGAGSWSGGGAACAQELGEAYRFAVPGNFPEARAVKAATSAGAWTWVNLHDRSLEGTWQANVEARPIERTSQHGGPGGDPFDHRDHLGLGLQWTMNIRKVYLRSNTRINKVGVVYNNGFAIEQGGNGGSYAEMSLSWNEPIDDAEVCIDRRNGKDRVFYLAFRTNRGRVLEGGTYRGTCTACSGREVIGLFGRSAEHLQALGFYTRSTADHRGWNHGEPNGGSAENCARFHGKILTDYACSASFPFACRNDGGQWRLSAQSGSWTQGNAACAAEGGTYRFAAPRTEREAQGLATAMAGLPSVWIHYSDRISEGAWRFGS